MSLKIVSFNPAKRRIGGSDAQPPARFQELSISGTVGKWNISFSPGAVKSSIKMQKKAARVISICAKRKPLNSGLTDLRVFDAISNCHRDEPPSPLSSVLLWSNLEILSFSRNLLYKQTDQPSKKTKRTNLVVHVSVRSCPWH